MPRSGRQHAHEALDLVRPLHDLAGMFKVGMQLFHRMKVRHSSRESSKQAARFPRPEVSRHPQHGDRARAVEAAKLGVSMMTIHTAGGAAMMQAVSVELREKFGSAKPIVVGVTVLTSLDDKRFARSRDLAQHGRPSRCGLAKLAETSGLDGVVCSPREISDDPRRRRRGLQIVTPGIRMPGQSADDQQRTATAEAIAAGADYIVVGRAVTPMPGSPSSNGRCVQARIGRVVIRIAPRNSNA